MNYGHGFYNGADNVPFILNTMYERIQNRISYMVLNWYNRVFLTERNGTTLISVTNSLDMCLCWAH